MKVSHGVFENTPVVTVKELNTNKKITCHFYRFFDDIIFLKKEYENLKSENKFLT